MKIIGLFVVCILGLFVAYMLVDGCMYSEDEWITGATEFSLTAEEITSLKVDAENGSAKAAFKLYKYYGSFLNSHDESLIWLKIAAERGHPTAKFNLDVLIKEELKEKTE